jgi:hypothetical protein
MLCTAGVGHREEPTGLQSVAGFARHVHMQAALHVDQHQNCPRLAVPMKKLDFNARSEYDMVGIASGQAKSS